MKQTVCVFNRNRESFLGLRVAPADTSLTRLRGLLGKLRLHPEDGIWLAPSRGIHTVGMLFAVDLIYLDANCQVIHLVEYLRGFRLAALKIHASSVLELPPHTIYSSQTQAGDQLVIGTAEEMESRLGEALAASERQREEMSGKVAERMG